MQATATTQTLEMASGMERWWPRAEPSERWVRVRLGTTTIAESHNPQLHIDYGAPPTLPTYYFRPDEIKPAILVDPQSHGDGATVWAVETGDRRIEAAAWTHPDPVGPLASLEGLVTFGWAVGLDWYEEEVEIFGHPRDPHKSVDVRPSSRHVEISFDGVLLADTHKPSVLFETMLPTRYYIPADDVHRRWLQPSETTSYCPYKGTARYWSHVDAEGTDHGDIAWAYPDPVPDNPAIKDLVCFFSERVDTVVDGKMLERPLTPWSS